jgi:hypothetical protein
VAVEKLHFRQNSEKSGDRKCLEKLRTSSVGHPDAILFLANFAGKSFSTATGGDYTNNRNNESAPERG